MNSTQGMFGKLNYILEMISSLRIEYVDIFRNTNSYTIVFSVNEIVCVY